MEDVVAGRVTVGVVVILEVVDIHDRYGAEQTIVLRKDGFRIVAGVSTAVGQSRQWVDIPLANFRYVRKYPGPRLQFAFFFEGDATPGDHSPVFQKNNVLRALGRTVEAFDLADKSGGVCNLACDQRRQQMRAIDRVIRYYLSAFL